MEKIEYYTLRPNLKQIYGKKVDEKTSFEEYTEDKSIHQIFKNLTLTTYIKKKSVIDKIEVEEESKIIIKVPSGTILIWSQEDGFVIPQYQMCTLEELKKEIVEMQDIYEGDSNDAKRDENKDV